MDSEDKFAPRKINLEDIRKGLTEQQYKKLFYECGLLNTTPEKLLAVAPFLLTEILKNCKPVIPEPVKQEEDVLENISVHTHSDEMEYYNPFEGMGECHSRVWGEAITLEFPKVGIVAPIAIELAKSEFEETYKKHLWDLMQILG